jgi:meckelin
MVVRSNHPHFEKKYTTMLLRLSILALCLLLIRGQNTSLEVTVQYPCSSAFFFDTSTLTCVSCPTVSYRDLTIQSSIRHALPNTKPVTQGSFPSADQFTCVMCETVGGNFFSFNEETFAETQTWIPTALAGTQTCACSGADPAGRTTIVVTVFDIYTGSTEQRRVVCPTGSSADSATCIATGGNAPSSLQQLSSIIATLNSQGAGIVASSATTATFSVTASSGNVNSVQVFNSAPLVELLGPAATWCSEGSDRAACNTVANLCALQLYTS